MDFKKTRQDILKILIEDWDPLAIKDHKKSAEQEYEMFVPQIISKMGDKKELYKYLEQIEKDTYNTGHNSLDIDHMADLYIICEKIHNLKK
jgi:hypothetical protein